ncbi:hypothetical protein Tco_0484801 [Tanacetum coccineum]
MTIDDVGFQTNNVVGNFKYPPNVPAYKPIIKFLLNCPWNKAFTNCPSVVYQNFLREFWSTAVAFDPEKPPLREFLIKFSVLNGQRPLTLDFKTFCSTTGLDYNNGKYMAHPTPEVVKKELGKIAINPSYLDKTPVLKNSFLVAWIIQFTFVIQVLSGNYSSIEQVNSIQQLLAFSLITGIEDPSKVFDIELTTHMIAVKNRRDLASPPTLAPMPKKGKSQTMTSTLPKLQGPKASRALSKKRKKTKSKKPPTETKRDIQLASTGLPSTLNEGTRKSKPLPEGIATHPQDSGGNKQPLDKDITSMTPDEGTAKTTPRLEGSLRDKDSGGNIPPADMKPIHTPIADPSGTDKESDEEEVLAARDDMDEDPQDDTEVRPPSPGPTQPDPSHV